MKTAEPIEIFVASYKGEPDAGYGAFLQMSDNVAEYSGVVGDFTKNQADLIAITMALRCVKPEYRDRPVILHGPSAYSVQAVERGPDGWMVKAKANQEFVQEVRETIELFKDIKIFKCKRQDQFHKALEAAKTCLNPTENN
jgi:ribonuclease HI